MDLKLKIKDSGFKKVFVSTAAIILFTAQLCFAITADEVLENHFKALGGKDKLRNLKSIYIKTKVSGDTEATSITWASSKYSKTETDLGGCTIYGGMNEKGLWESTPQGIVRYLEGQELKDSATSEISSNFVLFMSEPKELETKYIGEKQEGEKKYHILEVKTKNSLPVTLYFNEKTWWLDKTEYNDVLGMGGFAGPTTTEYLSYKNVDGLLLPYTMKGTSKVGTSNAINEEMTANPSFDKNIFDPPKHITNLVIKDNKKEAVIPFIKNPQGVIFLKIKINDSPKEYNFLLDSGASGSVISGNAASELKLELVGKSKASGVGNKAVTTRFVKVKTLHLEGGVDITDCFMSTSSDHLPIDGILGYDFICQMILEIDNKNSTLICHKPDEFTPPAGAVKIPLKLMWHLPFVDTLVNEQEKAIFLIDTGFMGGNVCLFSTFAEKAKIPMTEESRFQSGGVGGNVATKTAKINSIRLNNFLLPGETSLVMVKENMKVDGLCGSGFLSRFLSVTFDYYNKALWTVPRPWIGIKFKVGQQLEVLSAYPNSPAEKADLKNGDIILQLNKKDVNSPAQLVTSLENYKSGDKITLIIQRDKEKIEKELILQPMYYSEK